MSRPAKATPNAPLSTTDADVVAARLVRTALGPDLVSALAGLDSDHLSARGNLDAATAWHRVAAWVTARQYAHLRRFTGHCEGQREAALEVSCALNLSGFAADALVASAQTLTDTLPHTMNALEEGTISERHARAVVEAVNDAGLDPIAAAAVETRALRNAGRQNVAQLRRVLSRAVITADPDAAARRHANRVERRHVRLSPVTDGMAVYSAELEAGQAAKLAATVTDYARAILAADPIDARTLDAARADTLVDLVTAGAAAGTTVASQAASPKTTVETTICVTVPLTVLLGLDNDPADLSGHGPINAEQARDLAFAAGATWRRLVTDPLSGAVLDVGRTRYRPPAAIADQVRATHPRCVFPSCSQPAAQCDLDHRQAWDHTGEDQGGATSADNLGPLCRRHHNAKTHGGWKWAVDPDTNITTWSSPTGHTYTKPPEHDLAA